MSSVSVIILKSNKIVFLDMEKFSGFQNFCMVDLRKFSHSVENRVESDQSDQREW